MAHINKYFLNNKHEPDKYNKTPLPPGGQKYQNHKHKCELEMINGKSAKCPYKIKRKNMSYDDKCDECKHLRIVNLNDDGDVIIGIE